MIAVGAPAASTFAVISPTSHHGQWCVATFKINGEERQFLSQLAEDQKSKVSASAPRYLYRWGKPKWPFGTHAWDSAQRTKRLGHFTIQAAQHPTHYEWGLNPHVHNVDPPSVVRQKGRRVVTPTISRRMCGPCSSMK
jgi:hypothetical protein